MFTEREQYPIKPAKNLTELRHNLSVNTGLIGGNLKYFVDLHLTEIEILHQKLIDSQNPKESFFMAGQTGSGKTTVVDYLFDHYDDLKEEFEFLYIDFRDETNIDDEGFHIVEILLIILKKVLEKVPVKLDSKYYIAEINKIEQQQLTEFKDEYQNHWSFASYVAEGLHKVGLGWNLDASRREMVRKIYKLRTNDVLVLLNDLLTNFAVKNDKPLLIFMDGLEKMQNENAIQNIFNVDTLTNFRNIDCRKIIATPVHLLNRETNSIVLPGLTRIQCKVRLNPFTTNDCEAAELLMYQKEVTDTISKLIELVRERIDPESQQMINDEVLKKAVDLSCGLITEYLFILSEAIIYANVAKSPVLALEHLLKASQKHGSLRSETIISDQDSILLLYDLLTEKQVMQRIEGYNKVLIRQILLNNIIVNINGTPCYFVNPLVEKTVKVYGKPLAAYRSNG